MVHAPRSKKAKRPNGKKEKIGRFRARREQLLGLTALLLVGCFVLQCAHCAHDKTSAALWWSTLTSGSLFFLGLSWDLCCLQHWSPLQSQPPGLWWTRWWKPNKSCFSIRHLRSTTQPTPVRGEHFLLFTQPNVTILSICIATSKLLHCHLYYIIISLHICIVRCTTSLSLLVPQYQEIPARNVHFTRFTSFIKFSDFTRFTSFTNRSSNSLSPPVHQIAIIDRFQLSHIWTFLLVL